MPKEKEKDDKTEDIVIVTDEAANLKVVPDGQTDDEGSPEPVEVKSKKKEKKPDEDEDDDDEEEEREEEPDTRLGKSEDKSDEEEAERKERQPHKTRRQRRREAEQKLRKKLGFLKTRNDHLERQIQDMARRLDSIEKTTLEARINHTKAMITKAESVMAEAHDGDGKGRELVEATRIRDNLRDDLKKLETVKEQSEKRGGEDTRPDPRVVANAQSWADQYDGLSGFSKSDIRIVRALDDAVAEDGFDPRTKAYWNELDRRLAEYLPAEAKGKKSRQAEEEEEDEERPQNKKKRRAAPRDEDRDDDEDEPKGKKPNGSAGGPRFRTGGPGRELKPNEVYLSKERIAAMKEAGVWDDPVLRTKYMMRYQQYDRDHSNDN